MPRMAVKTLQQRMFYFLLLPVALLLFLIGFFGFLFARDTMIEQWRESATVKLQRAAHHIDMRLSRAAGWIEAFHTTGRHMHARLIQEWMLDRIRSVEGVTAVNLKWLEERPGRSGSTGQRFHMGLSRMRHSGTRVYEVTPPSYDAQAGEETVTLVSAIKGESGETIGRLEVRMGFAYLLQDIRGFGWWQSEAACLVDGAGRFMAHSEALMKGRTRLGENDDPLELDLLKALNERAYGTILGPGHPPAHVGGFYGLSTAPWSIVLLAPGRKILAPIIRFRTYYFLAGGLCILVVVLLIHAVAGRTVHAIEDVSRASERVAGGDYRSLLPVTRKDEIGRLTEAFNVMVEGLREREFISNTFGRYVDTEIAKQLMSRPEALRLGGEKREVAILMADLRDFTPLSETLSPEVIIRLVNRFFSKMIEIIHHHGGIIVDFFGDSILSFFDPLDGPIPPVLEKAVHCALVMQQAMTSLNAQNRGEGLPELSMGIGLNAGEVVVGNIGSESRAKYGIVGAPVNLTHRIQSVARAGEVAVSESAYRHGVKGARVRRSFQEELKGVQTPMLIHILEISGHPSGP